MVHDDAMVFNRGWPVGRCRSRWAHRRADDGFSRSYAIRRGGTGRLYVDDGASAEQRRALEAIFQGKQGGAVALFGTIVAKWLHTKSVGIAIDRQGDKAIARVAGVGQVESTLMKDESGRVMTAQNLGFASFFNSDGLNTELAPSSSQWSDSELPHPFEHRSGARSTVNWRAD
jgi:hypothetical protein